MENENQALRAESEVDYVLKEGHTSCWVTIENISIHIIKTDEGVVTDLYPTGYEDEVAVAGTWLTFAEAAEDITFNEAKYIGA